jgi:carbamoyltransferase
MKSLVLTLGHNSSAILIEDGEVINGYEEERLTGIKADSHFPVLSILETGKYCDLGAISTVSVTHWDTYGEIDNMSEKHWDRSKLTELCPNAVLWSHDSVFTHHDAHMLAANKYSSMGKDWTIVCDGFGNFNEVLSIYHDSTLVHRAFGYDKSIGLLYQYATAFLGMKMNQDEYKLLGYEAYIDTLDKEKIKILDKNILSMSKQYSKALLSRDVKPKYDALCNVSALPELRSKLSSKFARITRELNLDDTEQRKIAIAYLVQSVVEKTLVAIVNNFGIKDITLTGGVFYNVKLNNAIMNEVDKISVCPLAGDQGAGLGVYEYYHGDLKFPQDLCFGKRNLSSFSYRTAWKKLHVFTSVRDAKEMIQAFLDDNKIVNVVKGDMEFGPRALGNTTTLFKPTMANVEYVNHLNGRNTIMPCAPITVNIDQFKDGYKVVNSLEHMIITLDYKRAPSKLLRGAAHKYPFSNTFSGRPQLIGKGHWLYKIVSEFGTLVNTSYNKHGSPILFTEDQIMETFEYQYSRDVDNRMVTIVVAN